MNEQDIINEVESRFGEWLEMAGEKSPDLFTVILCKMVIKEREKNEYYRRCFDVSYNAR